MLTIEWHTFGPVIQQVLTIGMVLFWTSSKTSIEYGNGALLDQFENESRLWEWHTFGPVLYLAQDHLIEFQTS